LTVFLGFAATTSFIPHPEKPKFRIQRKAVWRWEEIEWKVAVNRNDTGSPLPSRPRNLKRLSISSVEHVSPDSVKEMTNHDNTKGIQERLKNAIADKKLNVKVKDEPDTTDTTDEIHPQSEDEQEKLPQTGRDIFTDVDGWIYGDNKWEHPSDKGGMGKYTRYRRWTRVAVLREESEEIGPGFTGVVRAQPAQTVVSTTVLGVTPNVAAKETASPLPSPSSQTDQSTASERLRQRLQAAMRRESSSSS